MRYALLVIALVLVSTAGCGKDKPSAGSDNAGTTPPAEQAPPAPRQLSAHAGQLNLSRLTKNLKMAYVTEAAYPVGKAGPTPAADCCAQPTHTCEPDPALWQDPIWSKLSFTIEDRGSFTYSYEGTTEEYTAIASGDADCDGDHITVTAHGTVKDGAPVVEITTSGSE